MFGAATEARVPVLRNKKRIAERRRKTSFNFSGHYLFIHLFATGRGYYVWIDVNNWSNWANNLLVVIRGDNAQLISRIRKWPHKDQRVIPLWHYLCACVSFSAHCVQLPVLFSRCSHSQLCKRRPAFSHLSIFRHPVPPTCTIRSLHQSGPLCQTWSLPVVCWFGFEKRIKQFPPTLWCGPYLRFLLTLAVLWWY